MRLRTVVIIGIFGLIALSMIIGAVERAMNPFCWFGLC